MTGWEDLLINLLCAWLCYRWGYARGWRARNRR